MPAIAIDTRVISQELGEHLNYFVARSVDHRVLETLAVGVFYSNILRCPVSLANPFSSFHNRLRCGRLHVLRHQGPKQIDEAAWPGTHTHIIDGRCRDLRRKDGMSGNGEPNSYGLEIYAQPER